MKLLTTLALVTTMFGTSLAAQTPGTFTSLGTGCSAPSRTPPTLACPQLPNIGKVCEIVVDNMIPNNDGVIIAGTSDSIWNGITLPLHLGFLGGPNCTLYSSGECVAFCLTGNGTTTMRFGIPNAPGLVGLEFYSQFWAPDPGANVAGFAMSNAGKFVIGDQ